MFSRFDIDGDGYITKEEMTEKNEDMEMFDPFSESRTVGEGTVQEKVEAYFREMVTDGDGFINFGEFRNYFKPKLPTAAPDGGIEPEHKDANDLFLESMFSRFDSD